MLMRPDTDAPLRPGAGTLIHDAVMAAADRDPAAIALLDADRGPITYGQLRKWVDAVAAALCITTKPRARIAVHSHKSAGTIVAMLAVLRAGRAYVPIDPSAPLERRRFIVEQSGCALMLADVEDPRAGLDLPLWHVEEPQRVGDWTPPPVHADEVAYVLFTSGSTGQPKGVVITHRNAAAFVGWAARTLPLRPGDQVAVHAPLHFDVPVYDVYVGLGAGATVHPVPERAALFPQGLLTFLTERRISHLYAVPSALTALVHRSNLTDGGLPDLRQILYAGEEFQPSPLAALMAAAPHAVVTNLYGPIETNVITAWQLPGRPAADRRVPLGHPIDNVQLALLADDGSASIDGPANGEIVVAGDCVTPGYLNRADLTARVMVQLDVGSGSQRFYRTGDLGRRDDDGVLQILGRRDFMVKTRGYRVELGDVEAALDAHPYVADVAVVATPDPQITHRLHAVVVPAAGADRDRLARDLLTHCRARLPAYMVPGQVHVVDDLPRTATGKIARRQLTDEMTAAHPEENR